MEKGRCKRCGATFWSKRARETCGEYPCSGYSFIGDPPIREYSLDGFREEFLSFFENRGHKRVERRPVIARWRDDIYLTIASIAVFQPHVTSGEAKPPANPLVISQPCIRMVDLSEVGKTPKHLTSFEMLGHHAFNDDERVYWIEETVEMCEDFLATIGAEAEDVTYKKEVWYGGGNAGPCLEVVIGGLEVATLVFMNMVRDGRGKDGVEIDGERYVPMGREIVDTGYGLERFVWLSKGDETIYDSVHEEMLRFLGGRGPEYYRIADHTQTIAFMLVDGLVPSNSGAGYLGRMLIRRALRAIEEAKIEVPLSELVLKQITSNFPELKGDIRSIREMLDIEEERYEKAKGRGRRLIAKMLGEGKDLQLELLTLYDTHGIPPELVEDEASKFGLKVEVPEDFYSNLASLKSVKKIEKVKVQKAEKMGEGLYYAPIKKFKASVVSAEPDGLVLDRTAFYPEGGGQPSDRGWLVFDGKRVEVKGVKKEGGKIVHEVNFKGERPKEVEGIIDWDWRMKMTRAHTATHIILYSCRELLGDHVWQMGAQKGLISRLDISHYKPILGGELEKIEERANEIVMEDLQVKASWMERNEAERRFKRLYQGGAVPGGTIRVVEIEGLDAQACAGTHVGRTGEIGYIKIISTERVQDGIIRINFSAGEEGVRAARRESKILQKTAEELNTQPGHLPKTASRLFKEWKERGKELEDLKEELVETLSKELIAESEDYKGVRIISYMGVGPISQLGEKLLKLENENEKVLCVLGSGNRVIVATNAGIDARAVANAGALLMGGSAGGKREFAQGGGPKGDLKEALARCVEEGKRLLNQL
jgi:alanyl-tRNA synthetase